MTGVPDPSEYMAGLPPTADRLVTRDVRWQDPPYNRWAFQHVREFIPTACIHRGPGPVCALERRPRDVLGVPFVLPGGAGRTVGEWLEESFTDGFLVVHEGRIVGEHYFNDMRPHTTHLLQSVSKSIVGTAAGILAGRGELDVDGLVTRYVPELAGGSFEGATVRHLLDMRTGTRFNEDYEDSDAEVRVYETVMGWVPPLEPMAASGLYDYITQLENSSAHGGCFAYRSILTDLLGWVLERASGRRLPELLGREIWSPMGAEFDADVTVDRHGSALADGGICVALRDLGRFGQMYLQDGVFNGRAIVPREWVIDCRTGDEDARRAFAESPEGATMPGWFYRNKWWVKDAESGVFMGLGIYGQMVYVNQAAGMVGVKLSTLPVAWNDAFFEGTVRCMDALAEWIDR
jgi:hypothetical protein